MSLVFDILLCFSQIIKLSRYEKRSLQYVSDVRAQQCLLLFRR